jgi:predicted nucleic acid-binding protein
LSIQETARLLQDFVSWEIVVNTAESVNEALAIELRYNVSFWNALILQAAAASGAMVLFRKTSPTERPMGPCACLAP